MGVEYDFSRDDRGLGRREIVGPNTRFLHFRVFTFRSVPDTRNTINYVANKKITSEPPSSTHLSPSFDVYYPREFYKTFFFLIFVRNL